jgi:hypothetical protein
MTARWFATRLVWKGNEIQMSLRIHQTGILREAYGPYHIYHLARGLTLNIGGDKALLRGGSTLTETFNSPIGPENGWPATGDEYFALIQQVEELVGVPIVALGMKNLGEKGPQFEESPPAGECTHVIPPACTIFRIDGGLIVDDQVGELALAQGRQMERYIRVLISGRSDAWFSFDAQNAVAGLREGILAGNIGPDDFDKLISQYSTTGLPVKEALFLANAGELHDAAKSAMLRACHHFTNMTLLLWKVNSSIDVSSTRPKGTPHGEIKHMSERGDRVGDEFTSSVIACYSALDLLFQLFVYITRQPFGEPKFPAQRLHFPDNDPQKEITKLALDIPNDVEFVGFPSAIPNLTKGRFTALRKLRNDLVHNMSADEIRTPVWIGVGLPPVNNQSLQYARYITRDILADGEPIVHAMSRRFYQQGRDAQEILHDWLEESWQCLIDTFEWLTLYMQRKSRARGLA